MNIINVSFLKVVLVLIITTTQLLYGLSPAPSNIYVGVGYFSGEYYDFYTDNTGNSASKINISDYVFYKGNTYTFHKISGYSHPFYLSDIANTSNGSYHLGTLSFTLASTSIISQYDGIIPGESFTFTIPNSYNKDLHYYCTRVFHTSMVSSLNVADPPSYVNADRLIITEVDRQNNYIEITYFGQDSGILEQQTIITNIFGDSIELSAGIEFESGETKEFTTSLSGTAHLQLIALDANNPAYWVNSSNDSNKGYFFDQQIISDPLPDVPQGEISIGLQTVCSGMSHLIGIADPNDDSGRIFLIEQTGKVKVLEENGVVSENSFMDISNLLTPLVLDTIGYDERGLLGLALSPSFSNDGTLFFYASYPKNSIPDYTIPIDQLTMDGTGYADIDHHSVIIKRTYSDDNSNGIFDYSDSFTDNEILRFEQPTANSFPFIGSNHNGGHLFFDSEGLLMIAIGDGGDANDTGNGHASIGNGADPTSILGTLIRIDPYGSNSNNGKYGIPEDNPFYGHTTYLEEIYAYGFRNPWTFTQDPVTKEIYSADSGQNTIQEVNRILPGQNYGWRAKEGSFLFDPVSGNVGSLVNSPNIEGIVDPIIEYDHDQGYANIIGGHIYRGSMIPELNGAYVCGDYGPFQPPGELFYVENLNTSPTLKRFKIGAIDRELLSDVRAFSIDSSGEIYFVGNSEGQSSLYKIVPLIHLEMEVLDTVNINVIGDEGSQISLLKSSNLDFGNAQSIPVNNGKLSTSFSKENSAFFKVVTE